MIATAGTIVIGAGEWLYGLGAVGLPVAAHLLARRSGPAVVMPTQRFVAEVVAERRMRRGLGDLLLMVMRCLIVGMVVVAFARVECVGREDPTLEKRGLQESKESGRGEPPLPLVKRIAVVSDEDADDPGTATFYLKRLDREDWRVEVVGSGGEVKGFDTAIVVGDVEVEIPAVRILGAGEGKPSPYPLPRGEGKMLEPMDPRKGPWEVFRGPAMVTLREVEFGAVGTLPLRLPVASDVLARWSDGEAAIWFDYTGRRRGLIFNADISPGGSELVRSAAFVALMHELVEVVMEPMTSVEVKEAEVREDVVEQEVWELWRWLLVGALVVMGVETIAVRRVGGRYMVMRVAAAGVIAAILVWPVVSEAMESGGGNADEGNVNIGVRVDASATEAYVGEQAEIAATVRAEGWDGGTVKMEFMVDGEAVESVNVELGAGQKQREIIFKHVTGDGGEWIRYAARAGAVEGEKETGDNEDEAVVRRMERRMKVLMIEGEPAWASRWFADAMRRDPRNMLTQWVAYGEGRTAVLNAEGEERPGISDFDVVVLGRGIERLMGSEEVDGLVDFVVRRGGGLVMARGGDVTRDAGMAEMMARVTPDGESQRIGAGRVIVVRDVGMWRGPAEEYREWVGAMVRFAGYADEGLASEGVRVWVEPTNVGVGEEVRVRVEGDIDRVTVRGEGGDVEVMELSGGEGRFVGRYSPTAVGLHVVEGGEARAAFLVSEKKVKKAAAVELNEEDRGGHGWDRWWVFGLLVGLLSVEWFMRRMDGLR